MATDKYLNDYYNGYDEDGRLASRHGSVEFLTTMRYIEKHLNPGDRVLEIGAGTGRYSHALARRGYTVDAVELIEHNIELFRKNTGPEEKITVTQGNALDLTGFSDDTYDMTLLLGPMYHLFTKEDKQRALSEAIRVTKEGGTIFTAYCISDASILQYGFQAGHIHELLSYQPLSGLMLGLKMPGYVAYSDPSVLFEIIRKEDIDELMADFNVTRLHYVATDGYTNHMRETVDAMDDKTFAAYLDYHYFLCERPDMVGLTHHALDIFKKG